MRDAFLEVISDALSLAPVAAPVTFDGDVEGLPAWFDVTGLAAATIGAACREIRSVRGTAEDVRIDTRLASFWFDMAIRPRGWALPPAWDAIAGDYRTSDGWIQLHTNAAHHRQAVLDVLGCDATRDGVTAAVADWSAEALESAVVANGGCAAQLRSIAAWQTHPQGIAVAQEPLIHWQATGEAGHATAGATSALPLAGTRILDMTRILAGPVATRLLAGFGADVLRIDPPHWDEPALAPEVTLGKHCAALDAHTPAEREQLIELMKNADVLVHGYRPDALDTLGLGDSERRRINPGLIDIALCAYGWTGPWALRRGFDSLVQRSAGIAAFGMRCAGAEQPVPLPVQALDHATGYLLAAAAAHALRVRANSGAVYAARLSLARTAEVLIASARSEQPPPLAPESPADLGEQSWSTQWGPADWLRFPSGTAHAGPAWHRPPRPLHSDPARFVKH